MPYQPHDPQSAFLQWLEQRLEPDDLAEAGRQLTRMIEFFGRSAKESAGGQDADLRRRVRDGAIRVAEDAALEVNRMFPDINRIRLS